MSPALLLGYTNLVEAPAAGANSVELVTASAWSPSANRPWLHLGSGYQAGSGSTNVIFTFDANPGDTAPARTRKRGELHSHPQLNFSPPGFRSRGALASQQFRSRAERCGTPHPQNNPCNPQRYAHAPAWDPRRNRKIWNDSLSTWVPRRSCQRVSPARSVGAGQALSLNRSQPNSLRVWVARSIVWCHSHVPGTVSQRIQHRPGRHLCDYALELDRLGSRA